MSIFTDDTKGADKDRVELSRKAIAESGGMAMGSGHAIKSKEAQIRAKQEKARQDQLLRLAAELASPEDITRLHIQLDSLQERLDTAFAELEEMRADIESRTLRLEDGTAIYRMESGRFSTTDGQIIPASQLPENIPENAATLAEREAMTRRAAQLSRIQGDMNQDRETLDSGDATKKDVHDIERRIEQADNVLKVKLMPHLKMLI